MSFTKSPGKGGRESVLYLALPSLAASGYRLTSTTFEYTGGKAIWGACQAVASCAANISLSLFFINLPLALVGRLCRNMTFLGTL